MATSDPDQEYVVPGSASLMAIVNALALLQHSKAMSRLEAMQLMLALLTSDGKSSQSFIIHTLLCSWRWWWCRVVVVGREPLPGGGGVQQRRDTASHQTLCTRHLPAPRQVPAAATTSKRTWRAAVPVDCVRTERALRVARPKSGGLEWSARGLGETCRQPLAVVCSRPWRDLQPLAVVCSRPWRDLQPQETTCPLLQTC
ncbi:uncharacterized protein LOC125179418 [Hyalella azteca]|uniref:Uncharacterized protein LOC125179418 n=1 Tax=Hyalella azteca TaxID=294128 RepID=A0A979FY53_HYAAZ|nr:uncharacterized protein LOC125179418 [Hyalella azteca]